MIASGKFWVSTTYNASSIAELLVGKHPEPGAIAISSNPTNSRYL